MRKQNVEERRTKLNENEWDKLRKLTDAYTVIRWISFGTVVAFLTLTGITILLVFLFRIFENGFEIGGLIPFTFFLSTACFLSDPSGIGFLGAVSVFFIVVVLCLLSGREPSAVGALIAFIVLDWITGALSGFIDAGGVEIFGAIFRGLMLIMLFLDMIFAIILKRNPYGKIPEMTEEFEDVYDKKE